MAFTSTFTPTVVPGSTLSPKTFHFPGLPDFDRLHLTEYIDLQAEQSPHHRFGVIQDEDGKLRDITWREYAQTVHAFGHSLRELLPPCIDEDTGKRRLIGLLLSPDLYTSLLVTAGLLRAGYQAFLISTRNSDVAIANLLEKTGCSTLLVGRSDSLQKLAKQARDGLEKTSPNHVEIYTLPSVSDLHGRAHDAGHTARLPKVEPRFTPDEPLIVLHSSGSTGFPKATGWSHNNVNSIVHSELCIDVDIASRIWSIQTLPGFHAMAPLYGLVGPIWLGYTMPFWKPEDVIHSATPEKALTIVDDFQPDYLTAVPTFLESWSKDAAAMAKLKKLKRHLMYGGGPLSQHAATTLSSHGIRIYNSYGTTELGSVAMFNSEETLPVSHYNWVRIPRVIDFELEYKDGTDEGELVVKSNQYYQPFKFTDPVNRSYHTGDLVTRDPHNPQLLKLLGRADDQLIHSTGEKTSPQVIEDTIRTSPLVKDCILFGHGRFQVGVLIEPGKIDSFDGSNENVLSDLRNKIWPAVEGANGIAPQHSRIFKEMIIFADPKKPFSHAGTKALLNRKATLAEYADEIDEAYKAVERSSDFSIATPDDWHDSHQVEEYVTRVVTRIMTGDETTSSLVTDADIFQQGCDSLQATYIRNTILSALRQSSFPVREIPQTFVYNAPTIKAISNYVSGIVESPDAVKGTGAGGSFDGHVKAMKEMIARYTADLPRKASGRGGVTNEEDGGQAPEVVVLTGSTGGLGCQLLYQLARVPSVTRIYALNRSSDRESLRERQANALRDRGLEEGVLEEGKITLIEARLEQEDLGLSESLLDKIRSSATLYIHNAWRLDFNLPLSTFEPFVKGTANLIRLALSSPSSDSPRFLFTSSVGVFSSWRTRHRGQPPNEVLEDLGSAFPIGYGESKLVAEKVLEAAIEVSGLRGMIVRLGQLAGSESNGSWATTDWVPILVKTSKSLGCLPDHDETVTWMTVTSAASTIISLRHAPCTVVNVVHPRPSTWTSIFSAFGRELGLPLVPYTEWYQKLTEVAAASSSGSRSAGEKYRVEDYPAVKLVEFFKSIVRDDMSTTKAARESEVLREVKGLGGEDVRLWIHYWKGQGFI